MPDPSCVRGKAGSQDADQGRDEHSDIATSPTDERSCEEVGRRMQGHPSIGLNKASGYTFSKPLAPKFVREVSLATQVHGFATPEHLCFLYLGINCD